MCLDYKMSNISKYLWMMLKPENIIAYKVVIKRKNGSYGPVVVPKEMSFKKKNKISDKKAPIITIFTLWQHLIWITFFKYPKNDIKAKYQAFFHLFATEKSANGFMKAQSQQAMIKCSVPKKSITAVGKQNKERVIVTKTFKIIEEMK